MNYLKLYAQYFKTNVLRWVEYKTDFLIGIAAMFFTNMVTIVFISVIFMHIHEINGWTFPQLLFLVGLSQLAFGFWHVFLCGLWGVEEYIRWGDFDRFLIRPANTLFQVIANWVDDDGIGNLLGGAVVLTIASSMLGLSWTAFNVLMLALSFVGGVLILLALTLIPATIAFWTTRSQSLMDIILHFTRFIEYPIDIYASPIVLFLTFILPFAFINYYPAQIFLKTGMHMQLAYLTPIVGVVCFAIAYSFWKIGIKNYSSVGH